MTEKETNFKRISSRIVFLSILLLFFTIPHTLEDFASGEPGKAGIPAPLIALVVSVMFGLQALGLYWLGQNRRRGLWVQLVVGGFWPLAAGLAQIPTILSELTYRSGLISVAYVAGILVVGIVLLVYSALGLRDKNTAG